MRPNPVTPSKIKTLSAGLGTEYESTLAALKVGDTANFKDVVSKLKRLRLGQKVKAKISY